MTDQTPPTEQQLDEIEACVTGPLGTATVFDHTTVAPLVAEVRRLRAELALATNATEYRVPLPDNGGITLLVRRQNLAHGDRWAVSTTAHGGGRAWTTEGWQEAISALSVDRLFCWPDPATAVAEARDALAVVETGE